MQVFDTWGGVLSPTMYREFSLRYLQRIAAELPRGDGAGHAPLILFGKGNDPYLEELAASGAEAVGVDWTVGLGEAARRIGGKVAIQGNLDPVTLYAQPDAIRREVGMPSTTTPPATAARARATCSISATACPPTCSPITLPRSSTPCTSSARADVQGGLHAHRLAPSWRG